ncbi:MAG: T9SS type A sorting domain-containing protein, partial [Muribaculaceae bacterium]|nr:T9SS type A sorting domain-containing protein [Muribaculaceae bacterium]
LASVKEIATDEADADAEVSRNENGVFKVTGAKLPVTAKIVIAPDFGDAGTYSFKVLAADDKGHETSEVVAYEVEKVNRAPQAVEGKTVDVKVGELSEVTEFNDLFSDPDKDEMTFSFNFKDNDIAEAYTTSSGVVFRGKAVGTTTATVTATDTHGNSTPLTLTVNVTDASGVDEIGAEGNRLVSVKENPVRDNLVVCVISGGRLEIELFDAAGKQVYRDTVDASAGDEITVNMGGDASGIYLLRVAGSDNSETHRILKK